MYKQVIVLRTDLKMGKGKLVAQGAHASLQAYKKTSSAARAAWEAAGSKKIVVKVSSKRELFALVAKAKRLPHAVIRDAGLTQTKPGDVTALGIGPVSEGKLRFTEGLKLL